MVCSSTIAVLAEASAQAPTAHAAAIAALGDAQICTASYTGAGGTSRSLTFAKEPYLVAVVGFSANLIMTRGCKEALGVTGGTATKGVNVTWSGNTVSWSGSNYSSCCDASNQSYSVVAICKA